MGLEPPRQIGAYEILEPLGAGGMGELYRARDNRLGRHVALKFVAASRTVDASATDRLQREARLASALNHPGIITVHDVGWIEDRAYIVMELVEGETLASRLARGPLSYGEALGIAVQAASALAATHDVGIVHRDLKPANIMLTADGRVKIIDFGLGKITSAMASDSSTREALTAERTVVGSAGYMAPEQVLGEDVERQADQFSLGVVLYEMLTGKRPFVKPTSIETMAAIVGSEPQPITELRAGLPAAAITVIQRCLAKQPNARYDSTLDLVADLKALADLRGPSGLRPPFHRRRVVTAAAAAGLVAAVILLVATLARDRASVVDSRSNPPLQQVVVLPFVNVTKDADDQVLCDGLVETLTSSLSELERFQRALRVVPSTEVRRDGIDNVRAARAAFGATLAITGALQRSGDRVRLTLNLVDAAEVRQIASRTLDLALTNMPTQDIIANVVTALLDLQLAPEARSALTAGGTQVSAAYDAYLRGRGFLQRFDKPENIDRAIELFAAAINADGRHALAHAALGEAYWRKFEREKDVTLAERAAESCARALAIDERLAPVHVTLSIIARGRGRYEEAIEHASRAVALDRVGSDGYRELGRAYEAMNRLAEAEATYRTAVEARPDDWRSYNTLGSYYYLRGEFAKAEAAYLRVTALTPDNTRGYNNLGATYFALGRHDESIAMFERSMAIRPTASAASNLGTFYYRRQRYAEAARAYERALALTPQDYRMWRNLGTALYYAAGERDKANAAFTQAIQRASAAVTVNPRQVDALLCLADSYSMMGNANEALPILTTLERLNPAGGEVLFNMAIDYEHLGDRARALAFLQRALVAGHPREFLEASPSLVELRKDPGYEALRNVKP